MQKFTLLLLTAVCGLFFTCKSTRYKTDNLPQQQIRWGKGGGITGAETAWLLLENGQLFRKDGINGMWVEQKKAKAKKAKAFYERLTQLDLSTAETYKPGNMYHFVEIPDGKSGLKRVAFDPGKTAQDAPFFTLYKDLTGLQPAAVNQ